MKHLHSRRLHVDSVALGQKMHQFRNERQTQGRHLKSSHTRQIKTKTCLRTNFFSVPSNKIVYPTCLLFSCTCINPKAVFNIFVSLHCFVLSIIASPAEELVECGVGDGRSQGSNPNREKVTLCKTEDTKQHFKKQIVIGITVLIYRITLHFWENKKKGTELTVSLNSLNEVLATESLICFRSNQPNLSPAASWIDSFVGQSTLPHRRLLPAPLVGRLPLHRHLERTDG